MASTATFDAFVLRITDGFTAIPVIYENEFAQPYVEASQPFVYVEVFGDTYDQESFGAPQENIWLEQGATYLHVMVPSGQGTRQARGYCNDLLNLFREQPLTTANGTIFMPKMSIGNGEPGQDFPNFFAVTAAIYWHRRDITDLTP